jgi:hypothetical protein
LKDAAWYLYTTAADQGYCLMPPNGWDPDAQTPDFTDGMIPIVDTVEPKCENYTIPAQQCRNFRCATPPLQLPRAAPHT